MKVTHPNATITFSFAFGCTCLLMTPPVSLTVIDWITVQDNDGVRCQLDLAGHAGWCCHVPFGFCIATEIPLEDPLRISTQWLHGVTLAVAGTVDLHDDHLCIAHEQLWWVHRFPADATTATVEAQINRQLLACDLLARQAAAPDETAANGQAPLQSCPIT